MERSGAALRTALSMGVEPRGDALIDARVGGTRGKTREQVSGARGRVPAERSAGLCACL